MSNNKNSQKFLCDNTRANNVIVVWDNLTTTNMDPCENINYCTCLTD